MLCAHLCSVLKQPQALYSLVKRGKEAQREPLTHMQILSSLSFPSLILAVVLLNRHQECFGFGGGKESCCMLALNSFLNTAVKIHTPAKIFG